MIIFEDECCNCATESYPCMGDSCPNKRVPHYICDKCDEEDTLYEFEGRQLCSNCLLNELEIVEYKK